MFLRLRKFSDRTDPILCAIGSLIVVPSLFSLILLTRVLHVAVLYVIIGISVTSMCMGWTLVSDMHIYTIYPNKRSMASALKIFICHVLGDAISPYILGAVS